MYNLISIQDIKNLAKGAQDFSNDFDVLFADIIAGVTKLFAEYCCRPDFDKIARTEYISPRCWQKQLFLKSPPISPAVVGPPAIEALRLYQDTAVPRAYGATTELVSGTDFYVHESEGVIEHAGSGFAGGPKSIKATYTGGYLTKDGVGCPADLKLAAMAQCKIFFDRREEYGVTGRSLEGGSITMLNVLTLPTQVRMLLDPYRLYGWAL